MNVSTAAWLAAGSPDNYPHVFYDGYCAHCGDATLEGIPTREVVSKNFSGFDDWFDPRGPVMCRPCTWIHSEDDLRKQITLVSSDPRICTLTPDEATQLLHQPLPGQLALIVPLHPGRKHLLPGARWGRVTIDNANLRWTSVETQRLATVQRLRSRGFSRLSEPTPQFDVLRRLDSILWSEILEDWSTLAPWRASRPWLNLALKITSATSSTVASV